jgi:Flp pilus assembly pilin Flp
MLLMAGAAAAGVSSVAVKINQAFTSIAAMLTSYTS